MRTEQQIASARLNGKKSHGPVTPMGKDRIRSNALKHGLTARLTLWANRDGDRQVAIAARGERRDGGG